MDTFAALTDSYRLSMRGGNPRDTFSAYDLDYMEVITWTRQCVHLDIEILGEEILENEVPRLLATWLAQGIAVGVQLERSRNRVPKPEQT